MGEADGLRGLEVGAAGEDGVLMFFGAGHVYGGQFAGEALPFAEPVGDEQAEVERDLIVAAAAVWSFLPTSPTSSVRRLSMFMWTSSSSFFHWKVPSSISARTAARPATS